MSPYIPQERRVQIDTHGYEPETWGELTYVLTKYVMDFWNEMREEAEIDDMTLGYTELSQVMGVLECVKQEFYRKMVAPFEDEKCKENGEVFK